MAFFYAGGKAQTGYFKYLGTGTTFDVKQVCEDMGLEYNELTANNFLIEPINNSNSRSEYKDFPTGGNSSWQTQSGGSDSFSYSKAYNQETGVFTCSCTAFASSYYDNYRSGGGISTSVSVTTNLKVYLYKEVD